MSSKKVLQRKKDVEEPKFEPKIILQNAIPVIRHKKVVKYNTVISCGDAGDYYKNEKIIVDPNRQRGEKEVQKADGSVNKRLVFDQKRVDAIAKKIIDNQLHGGSLTWNLRQSAKNNIQHIYDETTNTLYIMSGKPTIPDSNHRHRACMKVLDLYAEGKILNEDFDPFEYEFPLLIEVLDERGEEDLFFEYNQLGKQASATRAKYLNQGDVFNRITKDVINGTVLKDNVEIISNSISKNSTKIVTFNSLATAIKSNYEQMLDEENYDELRAWLKQFINHLATVRPELSYLPLRKRQAYRENNVGDTAIAWGVYIALSGELYGTEDWKDIIDKLKPPKADIGKTDIFSKRNPQWMGTLLQINPKTEKLTVQNSRLSQISTLDIVKKHLGLNK